MTALTRDQRRVLQQFEESRCRGGSWLGGGPFVHEDHPIVTNLVRRGLLADAGLGWLITPKGTEALE